MTRYARGTIVSTARSAAEIKRTIRRYGGDDIVTGMSARLALCFVQFTYRDLPIDIRVPLPPSQSERFWKTPSGKRARSAEAARAEWEKACRQQWRVLLLLIKANLEAVENEVLDAKEVWLPWLVLPDGRTVGSLLRSGMDKLLESGKLPKALPFGTADSAKPVGSNRRDAEGTEEARDG